VDEEMQRFHICVTNHAVLERGSVHGAVGISDLTLEGQFNIVELDEDAT
jgi:hypothetical protein